MGSEGQPSLQRLKEWVEKEATSNFLTRTNYKIYWEPLFDGSDEEDLIHLIRYATMASLDRFLQETYKKSRDPALPWIIAYDDDNFYRQMVNETRDKFTSNLFRLPFGLRVDDKITLPHELITGTEFIHIYCELEKLQYSLLLEPCELCFPFYHINQYLFRNYNCVYLTRAISRKKIRNYVNTINKRYLRIKYDLGVFPMEKVASTPAIEDIEMTCEEVANILSFRNYESERIMDFQMISTVQEQKPNSNQTQSRNNVPTFTKVAGVTPPPDPPSGTVMPMTEPLPVNQAILTSSVEASSSLMARSYGLDPTHIIEGGVMEDARTVAYANYTTLNITTIPIGTPKDSLLFKLNYGYDMFSGFILQWLDQHRRFMGPVRFRIRVEGASTFTGSVRIFWWPYQDVTDVDTSISSTYGSVDLAINSTNQIWTFTLLPNSDDRLISYFTRTSDFSKQPCIIAKSLTNFTNSFNTDVGYIQLITEVCLDPMFIVAEPIITTGTLRSLDDKGNLSQLFASLGIDLKNFRIALDGTTYPKYGVDVFKNKVNKKTYGFAAFHKNHKMMTPTDLESILPPSIVSTECEIMTITKFAKEEGEYDRGYFYQGNAVCDPDIFPNLRNLAILSDNVPNDDVIGAIPEDEMAGNTIIAMFSFKDLSYQVGRTGQTTTTGTNVWTVNDEETDLSQVIINNAHYTFTSTKNLTQGRVTVDFIDSNHPQVSQLLLDGKNVLAPSFITKTLLSLVEPLKDDQMMVFTARDPTFDTIVYQFVYDKSVGFYTKPSQGKTRYAFSQQGLQDYNWNYETMPLNRNVNLYFNTEGFGTFETETPPKKRTYQFQMASMVLGGLGGLFSGMSQSHQNQLDRDLQMKLQANNLANSQLSLDKMIARDYEFQLRNQNFQTKNNAFFHSPQGTSYNTRSGGSQTTPSTSDDQITSKINRTVVTSNPTALRQAEVQPSHNEAAQALQEQEQDKIGEVLEMQPPKTTISGATTDSSTA